MTPPAATTPDELRPLLDDPERSAVLLDVDGTLAPIVRHAEDAVVPETTRRRLIEVVDRVGVVACVSGRRASEARRIVGLGTIAYVGNHGGEILRPGAQEAEPDPELRGWSGRVKAFADQQNTLAVQRLRIRLEDKDSIIAFHWRGAPDEEAAEEEVAAIAARAVEAGFDTHRGRKVIEVRPPVPIDKGRGVQRLLRDLDVAHVLYAGDDSTDLDAFRALSELRASGRLHSVVRVGVRSDEGPDEITAGADLVVSGVDGVRRLLEALAPDS